MAESQSKFKPPFKLSREFYFLSPEDQAIYRREMIERIRQEGAKRDKPRDFSAITAENFHDFFDDMHDEISSEQRESLRRDVLAGRVPGFIDEDGAMHLSQGPVVRRPAEE